ncbi:hypothetical protein LTR37_014730 [Vermiconidia calcicola]|uniref:Uncharacterized protein n=1 Tax=Vermiconidia calcicola TaxID=1690605 RepID=A0ACC3MTH1_9PEZI|nr:hypothetical protein LTR37_014730 [Vermiconidia calcicola]
MAAVLLGLASMSTASPISSQVNSMFRRQEAADTDLCTNADLSNPEGAAAVWNDYGIGTRLDEYISGHGEDNWLNDLASESFPGSGDPGSFGCGSRDQPCLSGMESCETMAGNQRGAEFWIFNAIQKMQDNFERAHENLQDSIIDSSLSVSGIASDFKITFTSDERTLRYVAAAFGIAGGLVGYGTGPIINGLKTTATMFGGAFAASGNSAPVTVDPSKAMDSTLKEIFKVQRTILDDTLQLAVGGGGDYASLPDQSGDYGSSVAKFMADGYIGKFLMQGELVSQYFSQGYEMLNKKLVDVALQQFGYRVLADHQYEDAESCGAQAGAHWLDLDGGRCMRLAFEDTWTGKWLPAGEEISKAAEEKYGMDVLGYFSNVCDCSMNGSGETDLANLPTDGSLPQCFYNIACQDAESCLDEDGDHDWYICWPIDTFEAPAPAPEEPPAEPVEPFPTERLDTGCYTNGLGWTDLHGDGATDTLEVVSDIVTRCQAADGTVLGLNDLWWDCSEWTKVDGGVNHIWWEIQTEGDTTDEVTITLDVCAAAWNTELDNCSTGSESNHEGLWFRIDPSEGVCPFKKD